MFGIKRRCWKKYGVENYQNKGEKKKRREFCRKKCVRRIKDGWDSLARKKKIKKMKIEKNSKHLDWD